LRNIKLTIEYDGREYSGWQRQKNAVSVQETIEYALEKITLEKTILFGSGRTDSGVHALGQVANFKTTCQLTPIKFQKALNLNLPTDIVIISAEEVSLDFHAQYSANGKIYVYKILNRSCRTAIDRNRVWHVDHNLDVGEMKKASKSLMGIHDFVNFSQGRLARSSTTRNVIKTNVSKMDNSIIQFSIEADGFLKRMVRMLTGTLVEVGKGKITSDDFKKLISTNEHSKHIFTAPPWGLYLYKINY